MPIHIDVAISNSARNYSTNTVNQPDIYSTDLHFLAEKIYVFTKDALEKAKSFMEFDKGMFLN